MDSSSRAAHDEPLQLALRVEMAHPLVERLGEEFYADAERIASGIEPYLKETTWRFPRDSEGRLFAPLDWSSDGRRILGMLFMPGASVGEVTAIYNLDLEAYELAPSGVGVGGSDLAFSVRTIASSGQMAAK